MIITSYICLKLYKINKRYGEIICFNYIYLFRNRIRSVRAGWKGPTPSNIKYYTRYKMNNKTKLKSEDAHLRDEST